MSAKNHFIFWSLAFGAFVLFVYVFKGILLPFVLGIAIAYLLNPLVNKFARLKIGRGPAALIILFVFFTIVAAFIAALVPILYKELLDFSRDLPSYIDRIWEIAEPFSRSVQNILGREGNGSLNEVLGAHANSAVNVAKKVALGVVAGGQAVFDIITLVVLVPVISYFMMKEWNHITNWVIDLMPRQNKDTIMDLFRQIDKKISGFVRGQFSVALILAIVYALALTLAGLKYGFLIGFSAGLLSIIPMVGSTLGLIVGVGVAWFQTGTWGFVLLIAGIFLAGQFIEGNFLTPKLVGKSVGLHPLWVFFALLAGGALFGILGMFLAVPVTAVIGVLAVFAIKKYKASPYYKGSSKSGKKKNA